MRHRLSASRARRVRLALLAPLLTAASFVFFSDANAQWSEVAKARNGDVWMMDTATARRAGDSARIWVLINHPMPITNPPPYSLSGVRSTRALMQIDCRDKRARRLEASFFSAVGGDGRLLGNNETDDWFNVPPDTPDSELLRVACELADQAPPAAATPPATAPAAAPARPPAAPAAPARRPG